MKKLTGKTNIGTFTISDPMYDSKVKCRLSKRLPKKYSWNVEIFLNKTKEEEFNTEIMEVAIYILRENPKLKFELISDRTIDSHAVNTNITREENFIGVDSAQFHINGFGIHTSADGKWGDWITFNNKKKYSNLDKGLVGIAVYTHFADYCSSEEGYDLMNYDDVKKLFEEVFQTDLSVEEVR